MQPRSETVRASLGAPEEEDGGLRSANPAPHPNRRTFARGTVCLTYGIHGKPAWYTFVLLLDSFLPHRSHFLHLLHPYHAGLRTMPTHLPPPQHTCRMIHMCQFSLVVSGRCAVLVGSRAHRSSNPFPAFSGYSIGLPNQ